MKEVPKLSQLVDYLNLIQDFDLTAVHHQARHRLDALIHLIVNHPEVQFETKSSSIVDSSNDIERSFEKFSSQINDLIVHLHNLIKEQQTQYLHRSFGLFENEMPFESNAYILNRRLEIDDSDAELIQGKIKRYADWRIPGIIFRPGLESWIEGLVPLDPLYLVDHNLELLQPAKDRFHPVYQNRLRYYTVQEKLGKSILHQLPDGQIGYAFAYNYFNYKPLEIINQYLEEIFIKLNTGGIFFMTINDCDRAHGVALSEASFMCYTPGSMIVEHAEKLGYRILDHHRGLKNIAWVEIQKPGKTKSIRAGQTLAKIVAQSK